MKPIQAAKYVSLLLIALMLGRASAGVNASARLGVDLDLTSAAIDGGRHFPLNTEFDVNLVGENASDLHAVNFDLTYDPTLLSPVKVDNKWVREGPFLKANASGAQTVFLVDKQDSRINVSTAILGTQPGVDGNGVVAHVRFKTIASGASVLQLTNVIFVDHLNNKDDITANAVSGHVWGYGPATRFQVSVPVESTVGVQVTVRFTAQDAAGVTNPDFTGTVQLTSSDPLAVLPPTIAFTGQDNGVKSAPAVFRRVGAQTVTGADTVNPAISGTSNSTLVRSRNAGARLLVDADSGTQGVQGDRQVTNGEVLDIAVLAGAMGDLHGVNFELGYDALKLQLVEVGGKPAAEGPFLGTNASGASTTFLTASAAGSVNVSTSILGNVAGVSGDGVIALVRFKAISEGVASLQLRQVASTDQFGNQDMLDANSLGGSLIIGQPPADIVATRLLVSAPAQVAVGDTFNLTLTAIDDLGRTDTDYAGTVTLTTTDTSSTVPGSVTFAPADRGFKTLRVAFNTIGPQTVTAVDTSAGLAGTSTAAQVVGVNRNASTALDLEPATASPDASRLVLKNQAFDVAVELTNCRDVRGVNLDVLFDPALLQPLEVGGKSAQEGLFLSQAGSTAFLATIQGSVLNISTSLLGSGPGVDGAGRLATVRFKAIGVGVSSVRLANVILVDHFGNRDDISATASQTTLRITAATRLRVDCPGTATVGQPFVTTVKVTDNDGVVITNHTGTLTFTSSDSQATLPDPVALTTSDQGTKSVQCTFRTLGLQTLTAQDQANNLSGTSLAVSVLGLSRKVVFAIDLDAGTPQVDNLRAVRPEEVFEVAVVVADATELHGVNLNLDFDSMRLSPQQVSGNWAQEGPFLRTNAAGKPTVFLAATPGPGRLNVSTSILGTDPGVDGTGVLCTARFKVLSMGNSEMKLTNVILAHRDNSTEDASANALPATVAARDLLPPTLSELAPADGAFITDARSTIAAVVRDQPGGSGVDEAGFLLTLDGVGVAHTYQPLDAVSGKVVFAPPSDLSLTRHEVSLRARDRHGNEASVAWGFTVEPPLSVTTPTLPGAVAGDAYSAVAEATGGKPPYTWSLAAGALPDGVTLAASTGALAGALTKAGDFPFTVRATDARGRTAEKSFTVVVGPALAVTTAQLPDGVVGDAYNAAVQASGGTPPYTWSLSAGTLPNGVTLSAGTGSLTGSLTQAGTFSPTLRVTDAQGRTSEKGFSVTVGPALAITTTQLPDGAVGDAYAAVVAATGGTAPYTWSVAGGALPDGVTLNGATGALTGTLTRDATFSFTIRATDAQARTADRAFSVTVAPALRVTTAQLPDGVVGDAYDATLAAVGGTPPYTWSLTAGALPAGLALNAITGTLTGALTTAGVSDFTVAVSDSQGRSASKPLSITVQSGLTVTTGELPGGAVGDTYAANLAASGGDPPYTWSLKTGALPDGATLAAQTGQISGTLTKAGVFAFTVEVTDAQLHRAEKPLSVTVAAALQITTAQLPDGAVGDAYAATVEATGGTPPYTWSVSVGALPTGVTLNASSGALTGALSQAATATFTLRVTDSKARTAEKVFSVTVGSSLTISTVLLPDGAVGDAYSTSLAASGGTPPYSWSVVAGGLPDGLILGSASGALTGTLTEAASFTFTIRVADSKSRTAQKAFTVTVGAGLTVTTTQLPDGVVGDAYSTTLAASGGTPPYTWSVAAGSLPAGLSLNPTTGTLSGTPTGPAGEPSFTVRATDASNRTASKALTLRLGAALSITTTALPGGAVGDGYSTNLQAAGGTSPYGWSVTAGNLPDGVTLNTGTGALSGMLTKAGSFSFTVRATDAKARTAQKALSIAVGDAMTVTTTQLPGGVVGDAYSTNLQAAGGTAPYTWSVAASSLPAGLTLTASTGAVSGTPTAAGTANVTFRVTDTQSRVADKALFVTIGGGLSVTTTELLAGVVGSAYNATVQAAGGTTPYTWSVAAGALPDGVSLNSGTGALSGTPSKAGAFQVTLRVTDAKPRTAEKAFSITIAAPPTCQSVSPTHTPNKGTVALTVTGTHFQSGATVSLRRSGVAEVAGTGVTVESATKLTANFAVDGMAAGVWDVVVTNPDGHSGTLAGGLQLTESLRVTGLSPTQAPNSAALQTSIRGAAFKDGLTAKLVRSGQPNVSGTTVQVTNATTATATFDLTGIATGYWKLVVQSGAETAELTDALRVALPAPAVQSIVPSQSANSVSVTATITGTDFRHGATVKLTMTGEPETPGTGVQRVSATELKATFDLIGRKSGKWDLVVTNTDAQRGTLSGAFTVTESPTIHWMSPSSAVNVGSLEATVSGAFFQAGARVSLRSASGAAEIASANATVTNAQEIKATFSLDGAAEGARDLIVANPDGGHAELRGALTVTKDPPLLTDVIPKVVPNTEVATLTVTGNGFRAGTTATLTLGTDTLPGLNLQIQSQTKLTVQFDVRTRPVGSWLLQVSNLDGKTGQMPVRVAVPPKITSVTPANAVNHQPVTVRIVGSGFQAGCNVKVVKGDAAIDGTSLGVSGPEQVDATLDVTGVLPGEWQLIIANPDGLKSGPAALKVKHAFVRLWCESQGRQQIAVGRSAEYVLQYGNSGNISADFAFLDLSFGGVSCLEVSDDRGSVVWEAQRNKGEPLVFATFNVRPGEVRSLNIRVEAPADILERQGRLAPLVFVGYVAKQATTKFLRDTMFNIFKHKSDMYVAPDEPFWKQAGGVILQGMGYSLEQYKEHPVENLLWFTGGLLTGGTAEWMKGAGYLKEAQTVKDTWSSIVAAKGFVGAFRENFNDFMGASDETRGPGGQLPITPVRSVDPNEKQGPEGHGAARAIGCERSLPYAVFFENNPEKASAPAQEVTVTDQLSSALDWSTVTLGPVSFGGQTITVPAGQQQFETTTDHTITRPDNGELATLKVKIQASLNPQTGVLTWFFQSLDPVTGQLPEDPFLGFLPPNKTPPEGDGWVSFTVKPKQDLATGTVIKNRANIVFDLNEPIETPEVFNTIDSGAPTSSVSSLPETQVSTNFQVSWSGQDDQGGSGLQDYTVYVSGDGITYTPWLSNTTDTSATYNGSYGHTYSFYAVARDNVGNVEDPPAEPDATTTIGGRPKAWQGLTMASLPLIPDDINPAAICAFPGQSWARWDPTKGEYVYFANDPSRFTWFEPRDRTPGKGFWARFSDSAKIPAGQALPQDAQQTIDLKEGWNLIGLPFLSAVNWDLTKLQVMPATTRSPMTLKQAFDAGLVEDYAWAWNSQTETYELVYDGSDEYLGSLAPHTALDPWVGYWFKAKQDCQLVLPAPESGKAAASRAARRSATRKPDTNGWTIPLELAVGDLKDTFTVLGVRPAGRGATGTTEVESAPPAPGDRPFVDLSFVDSSGRSPNRLLAVDLRRPLTTRTRWELLARTNAPEADVTVKWPDLTAAPGQYRYTLIDEETGARKYMRTTRGYTFRSGPNGATRRLAVEVDTTPGAGLTLSGIGIAPSRGGGFDVSFTVSQPADVSATIRSTTGRVAATLAAPRASRAGVNILRWDGRSADGKPLPRGMYALELVARTEEGQAVKAVRTFPLR